MTTKLLSVYGMKFNPFRPGIPLEAIHTTPSVASFVRRTEVGLVDGGFAMITGDPGTGKTILLRLIEDRLRQVPNVCVGTIEHPQSCTSDFYRELGDLFGIKLSNNNRWAGFKALRTRWSEHIASTLMRPVLILDEAQETQSSVLTELRILASKDLDSKQLLCIIFAGDARLPERLRTPELLPLGSRIQRRITLEYASRDELLAGLQHLLQAAGNPSVMTSELAAALVDHSAGNYRVLMNLADELLMTALDRGLPKLDEKLFLDVFAQAPKQKSAARRR